MLSIQDYRNGRYQGQIKNNLPQGIGIFMHTSLTFVVAQWKQGQLDGKAIVIFPDASAFCGIFSRSFPKGPSFYELSLDQIKILQIFGSNQEQKAAILLPFQTKIIQINSKNFETKNQYKVKDSKQALELQVVAQIIGVAENYKKFYREFGNCYTYFQNYFCRSYPEIFEQIVITINGYKEYWIGFKEQGLGVRLQVVNENVDKKDKKNTDISKLHHRCLDGRVYIIREMGMMSKDNNLVEYGFKSINQLLKGYTIEQGIVQLPHTIYRYPSTTQRPKACAQTFGNHLKRSFHYRNQFFNFQVIEKLLRNKKIIEQDIIGLKKQVLAHSLIQKHSICKQIDKQQEPNTQVAPSQSKTKSFSPYKRGQTHFNINKNWSAQLEEVKKQIYNSIQLKKSNKNLSTVDYTNISKLEINRSSYIKKTAQKKAQSPQQASNQLNTPTLRNQKQFIKNDSLTKAKSKNREYIQLRKNGSITPRNNRHQIRQDKSQSTQTPVKSPTKLHQRTTPGNILKTDKKVAKNEISPFRQKIKYRDKTDREEHQSKKQMRKGQKDLSSEINKTENLIANKQKINCFNEAVSGRQSRNYSSRNKKKKLLNQLDNFQL